MEPRRKLIGVIGSGENSFPELSRPLGRHLAEAGYNLINGGGGGTMEEVAKSFTASPGRKGLVIGVLPAKDPGTVTGGKVVSSPAGYPNPFIDIPIRTHLHLSGSLGKQIASRNHIIILSADLIIALPGGEGTESEIELSLEYSKPLVLVSPKDEWKKYSERAPMVATIDEAIAYSKNYFSNA